VMVAQLCGRENRPARAGQQKQAPRVLLLRSPTQQGPLEPPSAPGRPPPQPRPVRARCDSPSVCRLAEITVGSCGRAAGTACQRSGSRILDHRRAFRALRCETEAGLPLETSHRTPASSGAGPRGAAAACCVPVKDRRGRGTGEVHPRVPILAGFSRQAANHAALSPLVIAAGSAGKHRQLTHCTGSQMCQDACLFARSPHCSRTRHPFTRRRCPRMRPPKRRLIIVFFFRRLTSVAKENNFQGIIQWLGRPFSPGPPQPPEGAVTIREAERRKKDNAGRSR